jgi:hypothetical protein
VTLFTAAFPARLGPQRRVIGDCSFTEELYDSRRTVFEVCKSVLPGRRQPRLLTALRLASSKARLSSRVRPSDNSMNSGAKPANLSG